MALSNSVKGISVIPRGRDVRTLTGPQLETIRKNVKEKYRDADPFERPALKGRYEKLLLLDMFQPISARLAFDNGIAVGKFLNADNLLSFSTPPFGKHTGLVASALQNLNLAQEKPAAKIKIEASGSQNKENGGIIYTIKYTQYDDQGNYIYGDAGVKEGTIIMSTSRETDNDAYSIRNFLSMTGHRNVAVAPYEQNAQKKPGLHLREKMAELTGEIAVKGCETENLKVALTFKEQKIKELKSEIEGHGSKVGELEMALTAKNSELNRVRAENESHMSEVKELKDKLRSEVKNQGVFLGDIKRQLEDAGLLNYKKIIREVIAQIECVIRPEAD